MTWMFLPQDTVYSLISSAHLRTTAAEMIALQAIDEKGGTTVNKIGSECIYQICGVNAVLAVRDRNGPDEQALADEPLLALWIDLSASTLASLPDEAISDALERLCKLADRLWGNQTIPPNWRPSKVEGYQTIFVNKEVEDLRIAYSLQLSEEGRRHVKIGSLFYAYRQEKSIVIPEITNAELAGLPREVSFLPEDASGIEQAAPVPESERSEPDVVIGRAAGENRHLFSMTRTAWMSKDGPLTAQQRRIINEQKYPLRIHGPGGSGKTLVLILKALTLLEDAAAEGRPCKILMVLHNNDVRSNVRAAIEAIDEAGFLASSKDDLQFLDVETLHGWCMRELKVDAGGVDYALHSDVVTSKTRQDEVLSGVLEDAISARLPRMRSLLSQDLLAHFTGPRDKCLSNCRHEIAIRIKGRGLRDEQQLYVDSPLKSFVGSNENRNDRYFLFKISEEYETALQKLGRLDTDDVVLSMQSRLAAPLWNRQRVIAGYDYVFVDETHLFNENERRVLPYLTRRVEEYVPIIMTFDEAQSIGGRRAVDLEKVGINKSEQRRLSHVHRSSPEIYYLARDLVERTTLMFSEFAHGEAVARMSERDRKKCRKPSIYFADGRAGVISRATEVALSLRSKNYPRVGVVLFEGGLLSDLAASFQMANGKSVVLHERGDSAAGTPFPGIFVMASENCGGLEFDAVILVGADKGRLPPSLHNISAEGHMSVREEACRELYTAITRARYHVAFICDQVAGTSEFVEPWLRSSLLEERAGAVD